MADDIWRIEYLYRDASNYKFWGEIIVSGLPDLEVLRKHLFDGEFLVPQAVGITSLVPTRRNDDDHDLHTFESIERCPSLKTEISFADLTTRLRAAAADDWFGNNLHAIFDGRRIGRLTTPT